ncbi:polyglutamine-binding protein 1 [Onthophagus taurus]|uniref:polyglutamine-binding protein 1 n=1 Tax=Onthophagus taurus TaxID=166361 RepID=UPI000C209242|nr:polyglutamine-binding protein 1 [Onthophagus taurus]
MPLPAALQAKLSKRGLILETPSLEKDTHNDYKGFITCPNKSNQYHQCTNWCQVHWKGIPTPDPHYARCARRLIEKYPLPSNWTDVFDKGLGRYYYWNMETDMVSWLPPKHPKSNPTDCAAKLRMKLHKEDEIENSENDRDLDRKKDRDRYYRDRRERDDRDRKHKHDDRERPWRKRNDDLDPMDPSAYSDIPRGTWSDGLEHNKSKADSTASGALYQQRPYPSPGEVLSGNKLKKRRDS